MYHKVIILFYLSHVLLLGIYNIRRKFCGYIMRVRRSSFSSHTVGGDRTLVVPSLKGRSADPQANLHI